MNKVRAFFAFWYDFIIGDDWRVALSITVALAATIAVNRLTGTAPWWIVLVAVIAILPISIFRATRRQP
ncbi:MAG: hypothetical protein ACRDUX_15010 [Mycobacterium sp.]